MTTSDSLLGTHQFANGRSACVELAVGNGSYTGPGRYTVTVLDPDGGIAFDNDGPNGVYQYETPAGVVDILARVEALPKES